MRYLIVLAMLLLVACGSRMENVAAPNGLQANGKTNQPGQAVDPWDAVPEPVVEINPAWLSISATEGDEFEWRANGKAISTDALGKRMKEYAAEVNKAAGMPGRNNDGISPNPVVFTAGPRVSGRAFCAMIELLVSAQSYRYVVELQVEGRDPRRIWQQLPVDSGLDAGPTEPEAPPVRDDDSFPDTDEIAQAAGRDRINICAVPKGSEYVYQTYLKSKDRKTHEETKFSLEDMLKGGWNEPLYKLMRRRLAELILTRQGTGKNALDEVQLTPMESEFAENPQYAHWLAIFLAMDAIDLANNAPNRGQRPELFTLLKFTDALAKYK